MSANRKVFKYALVLLLLLTILGLKGLFGSKEPLSQTVSRKLLSKPSKFEEDDDDKKHEHICPKVSIFSEDKCAFTKRHCDEEGIIPYILVRYCTFFTAVPWLYYILIISWMIFLFYMMSDTADAFFTPSLEQLSKFFRLSPDVAGVTFLALGNGAPDIFSVIAAVLNGSVEIGFGQPIGASLFINFIVLGTVIFISKENINIKPLSFFRDALTQFFGVLFVFICCHIGKIDLWQGILFFVIYVCYVGIVILGNFLSKINFKKFLSKNKYVATDSTIQVDDEVDKGWFEDKEPKNLVLITKLSENTLKKVDDENSRLIPHVGIVTEEKDIGSPMIDDHFETKEETEKIIDEEEDEEEKTWPAKIWAMFLDSIKWSEKTPLRKFTFFFEAPTKFIRNLTIPSADPEDWSKFYAVLSPIFVPIFILFAIERAFDVKIVLYMINGKFPLSAIAGVIGICFSILVIFTSEISKPPKYHFIFVILCFVTSICWFFLLAEELVSLLKALGTMFGISESILAITVLAFGFSVGDLVTDIAIARSGHAQMAVSAIFASPTLNVLISLGIAITATILKNNNKSMIVEMTKTLYLSFIILFAGLIAILIIVPLTWFRLPKSLAVFLFLFYGMMTIYGVLIEVGVLWD